jgi:hypothetical protein
VEGYTTQPSVLPGDNLAFCVSTRPAGRYRIHVHRLGWYDGSGGRLVKQTPINVGLPRDAPLPVPETGLVDAGWPVTEVVHADDDWVTGQYVARIELESGPHAGSSSLVPFVVPPPPGQAPALIVQLPTNTSQAYNAWGGKALDPSDATESPAATKVSFNRPVPAWEEASYDAQAPFHYELPFIRWLEREGYDAGYLTDGDTHREPWRLTGPRLVATVGHDEYWTREMRAAFDGARDAGTNLAFLGADQCHRQMRYEDGGRTIVHLGARQLDPEGDAAMQTGRFRELDPPKPEEDLVGLHSVEELTDPGSLLDFHVVAGAETDPWAAGAGFADPKPLERAVGHRWDHLPEGKTPPSLVRILHASPEGRPPADCIRWQSRSGATIFAAGSLAFPWLLDDVRRRGSADRRIQRFMRNAFDDMLS